MVGRDGLKLLLLRMAERNLRAAGDAELFLGYIAHNGTYSLCAQKYIPAVREIRSFSTSVRRSETTLLELAGSRRRVVGKSVARN